MMHERSKIIILYTLICLIWGSTWLVIKIGLETMTPFLAASLRFAVASIVLYGIVKIRRIPIPFDGGMKKYYISIALTSFSVPFAMVYWGEQHISSGLTSVLFGIYPFSVALFSYMYLPSEKLNAAKIIGIMLGFAGVFVIFANDIHLNDTQALWGMAAVVTSAVLQAFSVITIKRDGHEVSPFVTLLVPMAISAVLLLVLSLVVEDYSAVTVTMQSVFSILYLSIIGSIVTFVSYFWLLKRIEAVVLALSAFITPIIAVSLGVLVNHEALSPQTAIGAGCVLSGIVIANIADLKRVVFQARRE